MLCRFFHPEVSLSASLCVCETYYLLLVAAVPVNHDEVDEEVFVPGSSLLAFFLHLVIVLVVMMIVRSRRG